MKKLENRTGEEKMEALVDLMVRGMRKRKVQEQFNSWEEIVREYYMKFNIK